MCIDCLDNYDAQAALPPTAAMEKTAGLIRELYGHTGCGAGGPLHVVVDDYNLEDEHLSAFEDAADTADVLALAYEILNELRPMSLSQRAATVGLAKGYFGPLGSSRNAFLN